MPARSGQALRDAYGALSWDAYVQGKLDNLDPLIGHWPGGVARSIAAIFGYGSWDPAGMRWGDFFQLLPSLHALFVRADLRGAAASVSEGASSGRSAMPCCACSSRSPRSSPCSC